MNSFGSRVLRASRHLLPLTLAVLASVLVGRHAAFAAGATTPVFYSGVLTQGGVAASGPHYVVLKVYAGAGTSTVCNDSGVAGQTTITNGNFRVALDATCVEVARGSTDLQVEVIVDGTIVGRSALGTVPFALHADRAAIADEATHSVSASGADGALEARLVDGLVPPGTVVAFAGVAPPPGWLLCDGSGKRSADFPRLAAAIGTTYGSGSTRCATGGCNFNLPDYRGQFLRGVDKLALVDSECAQRTFSSTAVLDACDWPGSRQSYAIQHHSHEFRSTIWYETAGDWPYPQVATGGTYYRSPSAAIAETGGVETRPVNVSVHWIIKY